MDCGIPFCNNGCPLGNLIPDWNDLVYRDHWREAIDRLHATNNFPEFTGRLCPAPVRGRLRARHQRRPGHHQAGRGRDHRPGLGRGLGHARSAPAGPPGKRVAVVGSGPAGLAAAQQLTRAGHEVVVFERADRIGGLLRYGIPEFKMEKRVLDRRLAQMRAEGTEFRTNVDVGVDVDRRELRHEFDAVVLAGGATAWPRPAHPRPRSSTASTRPWSTCRWPTGSRRATSASTRSRSTPAASKVVIIGGGDTGADCLGTAHRQGAGRCTSSRSCPGRPTSGPTANPWPTWPFSYKVTSAHEEGGERVYAVNTLEFLGDDDGQRPGPAR